MVQDRQKDNKVDKKKPYHTMWPQLGQVTESSSSWPREKLSLWGPFHESECLSRCLVVIMCIDINILSSQDEASICYAINWLSIDSCHSGGGPKNKLWKVCNFISGRGFSFWFNMIFRNRCKTFKSRYWYISMETLSCLYVSYSGTTTWFWC